MKEKLQNDDIYNKLNNEKEIKINDILTENNYLILKK